jgi:hypothetical protein
MLPRAARERIGRHRAGHLAIAVVQSLIDPKMHISGHAPSGVERGAWRNMAERLDDAVMLLVVVLVLPFVILLVGAPVALLVRLLIEIGHRM